ncbi:MAG: Amuc_1100 family pilus-like protein, partial [Verrucomicrobiota bacterium]|nr:Amuc_1100 family pilus-like protein [Verrucomicrobiota bacterium]
MAGKININPEALKRNLDVIIVVVVAIGLIGYGWLQLGATQSTRDGSKTTLETETGKYNAKKKLLLDGIGLTNSLSITTDESHGNYALAEKAEAAFAAHLDRVRSKFTPLEIPDGIELDEKTGAIKSVMLMQGGTGYVEPDIDQLTVRVVSRNGKGAKLKPNLRKLESDSSNYRVENITVEDGGSGYTKGDLAILIEGGGGAVYEQPNALPPVNEDTGTGAASTDPPGGDPTTGVPGQMPGMMPGMMPGFGANSMGASTDESEARVGLDNNTFRNFMQSMVFGLQSQCKEQRIRLPKIDDEDKEFRFSFSKVWDQFEFKSFEREIMAYQLAEIDALCRALFNANIHEIYNLKRLKVVGQGAGQMEMEDALEYLPDAKFKIEDVKKFTDNVAGSRVMPYEVTFRGFSTELSKVLEELYKSQVFFVVKNIAVIEATDVADVFEEEQKEMSLGNLGAGPRGMREMYGGMGGGRGYG